MKKKISVLAAILFTASALAACSSGSYPYDGVAADAEYSYNSYATDYAEYDSYSDADRDGGYSEGAGFTTADEAKGGFAEKMIYSASVSLETTDFDGTIDGVYAMIDGYGGFIESSYISGQSYSSKWNNYEPRRTAQFVIRVPSTGFKTMLRDFENIGNVTESRDWADNITEQYYDAQSRLDTLRIEEERILAMLEKADNVTDMIELESRLSEIRYNIESITSRLRNWQNQVDYSTVTLDITEVKELTPVVEAQRTYWEEIGDGLRGTVKGIWSFMKELFKGFVVILPVLALLGVITVVTLVIIKAALRSKKKKRAKEEENK